jgi:uncharacterized integral membrane protein
MKGRGVMYVLAAIVIGLFVAANWTLLMAPVGLNFLVAQVQAPLVVLLLLLTGIVLLLDLAVHALSEHGWRRERRTLVKDLETARLRAEREEESRTQALRIAIERELAMMRGQLDRVLAGQSTLLSREVVTDRVVPRRAPEVIERPQVIEPELIPPKAGSGRGPR